MIDARGTNSQVLGNITMKWISSYLFYLCFNLLFIKISESVIVNSNIAQKNDLNFKLLDSLSLLEAKNLLNTRYQYYDEVIGESESLCDQQLKLYYDGIRNFQMWALQMFDSSSKIQSGILMGHVTNLGMYDECVEAKGEVTGNEIRGRNCLLEISLGKLNTNLPLPFSSSICIPSTCDSTDLISLVNDTVSKYPILNNVFDINDMKVTCTPMESRVWKIEVIVGLVIIGTVVLILLICTVIDIAERTFEQCLNASVTKILRSFSIYSNTLKLFNTSSSSDTIDALQGIRSISMLWVLFGHQYYVGVKGSFVNTFEIFEWMTSWKSLHVFTATFAVDTFLVISGLLVAYLFFKHMMKDERQKFNVMMYYFHRYIRLTPPLLVLVFFTAFVIPMLGSGALWDKSFSPFATNCRDYWWVNLLYLQNFLHVKNLCLDHSWYLATDMQLFWISPLILYPLLKKPKIGLLIWILAFAVTLITPALLVVIDKYPAITTKEMLMSGMQSFKTIYVTPYCRAGPWLIGILFGYELAKKNFTLRKIHYRIGWFSMIIAILFCIAGIRYSSLEEYKFNVSWEAFFVSFSRPIWGYAIAWTIYACIKGHGGIINKILSWKIFIPFARVSYCVYLNHMVLQMILVSSLRTPVYFSDFNMFFQALAMLIISFTVSVIFSLLFESPVISLEKLLMPSRKKQLQEPTSIKYFKRTFTKP